MYIDINEIKEGVLATVKRGLSLIGFFCLFLGCINLICVELEMSLDWSIVGKGDRLVVESDRSSRRRHRRSLRRQ